MSELVFVLVLLGIVVVVITLVGHGLWVLAALMLRAVFSPEATLAAATPSPVTRCEDCDRIFQAQRSVVTDTSPVIGQESGPPVRTTSQEQPAGAGEQPFDSAPQSWANREWQNAPVSTQTPHPITSVVTDASEIPLEPAPSLVSTFAESDVHTEAPQPASAPAFIPPRRRFSEVLNAFMEESNIRWGEVIGGLLIIGCSTALVVSLWAQISQIPVLKFLIFTTVTAILFGIGLYTEHRWKLPNTSRGILTIATLLVPLNFLAIAAVSSGTTSGALVIGSEVIAPAVFLTLIYYAGRVITPGCASLLSGGILLSSIGQLLVRHFGSPDIPPEGLIALAAFPVVSYAAAVSLALRNLLMDREIDEGEARTIFTMIGTMCFAASLPFGLLLHKSGPVAMTMMYVAPIVTLWGLPLLITGAVLWRRVLDSRMVASRTTGTVLAILGAIIVLAGVLLAWPNPASIVPAALMSFAVFTAVALVLNLPAGHLVAAICLALAYTVVFQVYSGQVPWTNLRVLSLWNLSLSTRTGQALVGIFFVFVAGAEWFCRLKKNRESVYYLIVACLVMVVSLGLVTAYGLWSVDGPYHLWVVYLCYSLGACRVAWSRKWKEFTWVGSALLLFSLAQAFGQILELSFPWQTALLVYATLAASLSIFLWRRDAAHKPFAQSALLSLVLGVVCLFQANTWQVTDMQARRVFWIAGILLLLLWNYRKQLLFVAFQIAATTGVILTVKAALQASDWYSYLPYVFLHPIGLQIQGTVLLLVGLVWIALRIVCRRVAEVNTADHWSVAAWRLLNVRYAIDRIVSWIVLTAFLLFVLYGAASGVTHELAAYGSDYSGFNLAGYPHQEVLGFGSWIVFGLLLLTLLAHAWERRRSEYIVTAMVCSAAAVPLIAGLFEYEVAVASAWRWLAAAFLLAGSIALWFRKPLARQLAQSGWPNLNLDADRLATQLRTVLLIVTLVPLTALTAYTAVRAIYHSPVRGAEAGIFSLLGIDVSYAVPFAIVAIVLIGYALRERRSVFALAGGLSLNVAVTIACLLNVVIAGGAMDRIVLVRLVQLNAITTGLYALAWLKYRSRWQRHLEPLEAESAQNDLDTQLALMGTLNVGLLLPPVLSLVMRPALVGAGTFAVGNFAGWLSLTICITALVWAAARDSLSPAIFASSLAAVGCLLSLTLADRNVEMLTGLHTLTISATALAWVLFAMSTEAARGWLGNVIRLPESWPESCRSFSVVAGAIAASLALRPQFGDPDSDWWAIVPLLALCGLAIALHRESLKRRYLVAAATLFTLASSVWWLRFVYDRLPGTTAFLLGSIAMLSLSSILWLALELRARKLSDRLVKTAKFSLHNFTAIVSFLLLAGLTLAGYLFKVGYSPLFYYTGLAWFTFLAVFSLCLACIWDRHARYAVGALYLLGMVAAGLLLQQLALGWIETLWLAMAFVALQAVVSSLLWRGRQELLSMASRFRIPLRVDVSVSQLQWLAAFNIVAVMIVVALAFWIDLNSQTIWLRIGAAISVLLQILTFALLAEGSEKRRWQRAAVAVFSIGLTILGWSWLAPGSTGTWLNRAVFVAAEAFALAGLISLCSDRTRAFQGDWFATLRSCVPWFLSVGLAALGVCLSIEICYQLLFGAVQLHLAAFATIVITSLSATVLFVVFALSRTDKVATLSERGRTIWVYLAEVLLVFLFVHVRLTMPWLFGSFERYWPFIVMAIAFAGVVVSELLRARQLEVLARPVQLTGTFLPLLPLIGFWVVASEVDYSALLFVVGALYGLLSLLHRSFRFGVVAAVCGNAGLWYYLQRTEGYNFIQHPQFWLVPVALSVLLAAYLNREDFTEDQMMTTRYMSLLTIYLSSTADIVINGVANSPWLPLILAAFSLSGIFAGIVLRIRGMLLMSSLFLLLSLVTMIWYASVNFGWTWLWYVAGIVTGATIIFMFAVFEKKRADVLRVVEGLRDWER